MADFLFISYLFGFIGKIYLKPGALSSFFGCRRVYLED